MTSTFGGFFTIYIPRSTSRCCHTDNLLISFFSPSLSQFFRFLEVCNNYYVLFDKWHTFQSIIFSMECNEIVDYTYDIILHGYIIYQNQTHFRSYMFNFGGRKKKRKKNKKKHFKISD